MNRFIGKICPYCKGLFTENDDIVVCSDCDMPHHKECWIENQGCTTFGCSGTIQSIDNFVSTNSDMTNAAVNELVLPRSGEGPVALYCTRCGSKRDQTARFCKYCGQSYAPPFNNTAAKFGCSGTIQSIDNFVATNSDKTNAAANELDLPRSSKGSVAIYCTRCGNKRDQTASFCKYCGQSFAPHFNNTAANASRGVSTQIPRENQPHNTPHAVEATNDEKWLVGPNYEFYSLKFKYMRSSNTCVSWNFAAFLFAPIWCLYRKMYGIGAALFGSIYALSFLDDVGIHIVLLGLISFGLFANNLYMRKIERTIGAVRGMDNCSRTAFLQKKCGTNVLMTILVAIGCGLLILEKCY